MKTEIGKEEKGTKKEKDRIAKAQKEYREIFEEIKPFIKKRHVVNVSTIGRWKVVDFE